MKNFLLVAFSILTSSINFAQVSIGSNVQILNDKLTGVHFFDENNGFAYGGTTLIKTNDGGENWTRFTLTNFPEEYPYTSYFSLLNSDKINESSSIVVGRDGVILKTSDKGQTWQYKSLMYDGAEIILDVDFINENIGFVVGTNETEDEVLFYKTIDAGENWTKIEANALTTVNQVNFLNENIGFVDSYNYLFRTEDGGLNWTQIENPSNNEGSGIKPVSKLKILNENSLIIATNHPSEISKIYISHDLGDSWELIENLHYTHDVSLIGGNFDVINDVFHAYGWYQNERKLIKYNLVTQDIQTMNLYDGVGNQMNDLYILNENTFYVVDDGRQSQEYGRKIVKSINGGQNWVQLDSFSDLYSTGDKRLDLQYKNGNFLASVIDGWDGNNTNDFYLYGSNDEGNSWKLKLKTVDKLGKILYTDGATIKVVTDDILDTGTTQMTLHSSHDFGNTWETHNFLNGNEYPMPYGYFMVDENTLIYSFFGTIKYSTNQGNNWQTITAPNISNTDFGNNYLIRNLNEIYAWGRQDNYPTNYDYVLYKKINMENWAQVAQIPFDGGGTLINTFFSEDYAIVSVGENKYYKVDLNNNSFTEISFNHPISGYSYLEENQLKILEPEIWMISNNYMHNYYSSDQGISWITKRCSVCGDKTIYNPDHNVLINFGNWYGIELIKNHIPLLEDIFGDYNPAIDSYEKYFVPIDNFSIVEWELLSGGEILQQDQKSAEIHWTENGLHTIRLNYLADGVNHSFEFKVAVGELSTTDINQNLTIEIYPNPFSSEINLRFPSNFKDENINVYLYDSSGKFIKAYNNAVFDQKISLTNLQELPQGVYYLKLFLEGKKQIFKVIKNNSNK